MYTTDTLYLIGDSRLNALVPKLRVNEYLKEFTIVDQTLSGSTLKDYLSQINEYNGIWTERSRVFISLGVNDARNNKSAKQFAREMKQLIAHVIKAKSMPVIAGVFKVGIKSEKTNKLIESYNEELYKLSLEVGCKFIDQQRFLKELGYPFKPSMLRDGLHFKASINDLISHHLSRILERRFTTILWQYNGWSAKCNYRCHYCYYIGLHHPEDITPVNFDTWEKSFNRAFAQQELVFYCAHGEPTFGNDFNELCDMVVRNEKWSLRVTSNIDTEFMSRAEHPIFETGRLYANASYHKTQTSRDKFLENLLHLRSKNIECPVVYVAHPKDSDTWEDDINFFRNNNFVVHLRRLQGEYKGKKYPWAYTSTELDTFLKYTDSGTIKYMLNSRSNRGDVSFTGFDFFIVDNVGNAGHDSNAFKERTLNRARLGNILTGSFRPNPCPSSFPGEYASTVDGVANIYVNGYKQLRQNNVVHFMEQGDVWHRGNSIEYGNVDRDFNSPKVRADYFLAPRNLRDHLYYWSSDWEFSSKKDVVVRSLKDTARSNKTFMKYYDKLRKR